MGKDWFEREHAEIERLASVLEPRARTMFAFLRDEEGFSQRPSTRRESMLWTRLIYRSTELGIEIELNYLLRLVAVWLVRLEQGKYPEAAGPFGGPVNGVVIRPRVETVLRDQLYLADPILDELERLRRDSEREQRDQAFLERMLDLYQQLLRRHLVIILQHPLAQLFPAGVEDQRMHQDSVRRELERQVSERFAFLRESYGFSMERLADTDSWIWASSFIFRGRDIGIHIEFDYREGLIKVDIVKLANRQPLGPPALNWDRGVRIRAPLERVIGVYLNTPDPLIGELRRAFANTDHNERDLAFGTALLEKYRQLLQTHIDALLRQPPDVIFPNEQPMWGVRDLDWR